MLQEEIHADEMAYMKFGIITPTDQLLKITLDQIFGYSLSLSNQPPTPTSLLPPLTAYPHPTSKW